MIRMLVKVLAHAGSEGQAQVAVNVDLAYSHGSGLAQLLLGDADGVGHLAAVFVDDLHEFLRNGGRAVQHDGEARQTLGYFFQDVEAQRRGHQDAVRVAGALRGGELVRAVAGADGDGQAVAAGGGGEFFHFVRTGVAGIGGGNLHVVFHAGQTAQLGLDGDIVLMGIFHHAAGLLDIFFKGQVAAVEHNAGETAVDAGLASFKIRAVIQMQGDGQTAGFNSRLDQLDQVGMVGVSARALADLQDQRRVLGLSALHDALDNFHVVDVESADGVTALIGFFEHISGVDKRHRNLPPLIIGNRSYRSYYSMNARKLQSFSENHKFAGQVIKNDHQHVHQQLDPQIRIGQGIL